jgi:hypothetical protein
VSLAFLVAVAPGWIFSDGPSSAQNQTPISEIVAHARIFPGIGPGVRALKRDSAGRYYVLAAPANVIAVFAADGKRAGQIPAADSQAAKIVFAEDIDLDSSGRLLVADRGANAVKIFEVDGSLESTVPVSVPTSLAALPGDEFAVASLRAAQLVTIYNAQGKMVRSFGDPHDMSSSSKELNRYINHGRLSSDSSGYLYFAFTYLPDGTIRKYDRFGFAAYEISLPHADQESTRTVLAPSTAAAPGVDISALARRNQASEIKPVINAFVVDPGSQEVWAAMGDELSHFGKDGGLLATYRTATANGTRLEPSAILIESSRILLAVDPLGVYEFSRPDNQRPAAIAAPRQ